MNALSDTRFPRLRRTATTNECTLGHLLLAVALAPHSPLLSSDPRTQIPDDSHTRLTSFPAIHRMPAIYYSISKMMHVGHTKPMSLFPVLRRERKMRQCIFEDTEGREHLYERSIQQVFERAVNKAGIRKYVCDHSLRQAFTTNLIENGVDRRFIQEFPEHSSAKTTAIITHV